MQGSECRPQEADLVDEDGKPSIQNWPLAALEIENQASWREGLLRLQTFAGANDFKIQLTSPKECRRSSLDSGAGLLCLDYTEIYTEVELSDSGRRNERSVDAMSTTEATEEDA